MKKILSLLATGVAAFGFSLTASAGTPVENLLLQYSENTGVEYVQFDEDEIPLAVELFKYEADMDFSEQSDAIRRMTVFTMNIDEAGLLSINFISDIVDVFEAEYFLMSEGEEATEPDIYIRGVDDEEDRVESVFFTFDEASATIVIFDIILSTADI